MLVPIELEANVPPPVTVTTSGVITPVVADTVIVAAFVPSKTLLFAVAVTVKDF